tara:strand:+ start:7203 stop:8156 length:954 start_codon:yes stop_codon:yes gene_type:complete
MNIVSELHLLIDWTCHFHSLHKDINAPLQLVTRIKMKKLDCKNEIISKFYDTPVNDFRGNTDFNIYIIEDNDPIYENRKTSKGVRKVNIHLFDLKKSLRKITGGCAIHATDNIQETKENLKVLGLYDEYYKEKTFNTIQDVFRELNQHPELKWIITHNFDTFKEGDDIDFLTDDYFGFMRTLDSVESPKGSKRNRVSDGGSSVRNYINVGSKSIPIDIRYLGDNYFDKKLQQDMLDKRIEHPNGFYIPNKEMHLYSLIYHAIIHKPMISPTYLKVFKQYGLNEFEMNKNDLKDKLDTWFHKNGYSYCKPEPSVGYFL